VRAYNSAGDSSYSNTASATTSSASSAPNAPSNLSAAAEGSTKINLSWTDNSTDETKFEIERSTDNVSFTKIAEVGADVTTYQNTKLTGKTTYYYRVRACNANGCSAYSNTASAKTK
jgi:titin